MIPRAILGRPVVADVRSAAIAEWMRHEWSFPEHDLPQVPFTIHLTESAAALPPVDGEPATVSLHRVTLHGTRRERTWRFDNVEFSLEPDAARITVHGSPGAALFLAVAESIRASGLLPLHASVVARYGDATALSGPSGMGKSTTLWRAMTQDWSPVAEDFAWLDPDTLAVYGWDRGVRLMPDARRRFAPHVPDENFRVDADGKLFLSYSHCPGAVREAKLRRLLVLQRTPETPMAPHDVVRAWWETVGVPLDVAVRDHVSRTIASLIGRVETRRLNVLDEPLPL